jgi:hypothetical protein
MTITGTALADAAWADGRMSTIVNRRDPAAAAAWAGGRPSVYRERCLLCGV